MIAFNFDTLVRLQKLVKINRIELPGPALGSPVESMGTRQDVSPSHSMFRD
jgi:hypothetical protein